MVPEFTKQLQWVAKLHFMIKFIIIFQEKKGMSCILMLHIIVKSSKSWCYYNLYFFGEYMHALDFSCHGYLKFKWTPCFTICWQIQVRLIYWFHRKYKLIDPDVTQTFLGKNSIENISQLRLLQDNLKHAVPQSNYFGKIYIILWEHVFLSKYFIGQTCKIVIR